MPQERMMRNCQFLGVAFLRSRLEGTSKMMYDIWFKWLTLLGSFRRGATNEVYRLNPIILIGSHV